MNKIRLLEIHCNNPFVHSRIEMGIVNNSIISCIVESVEQMFSADNVLNLETGSLLGGICFAKLIEVRERV